MQRILVTGATGFIGWHCLPLLRERGYEIHAVARAVPDKPGDEVIWHQADLLEPLQVAELMSRVRPRRMLHLAWYTAPETGKSWSIVSHNEPLTGEEPTMREYFFERVRPIVESALAAEDHGNWPLITLNLDFKSAEREHLAAVWQLLSEYKDWLTTAERREDAAVPAPLDVKPILVLTGESDAHERAFHQEVPIGDRLLVFGAVHVSRPTPTEPPEQSWEAAVNTPPEALVSKGAATNYRRWWNNSWFFVEKGGATRAEEWTPQDEERLRALVSHAHANQLWIRFYTLNGHDPADESQGWATGYNFGSGEQAEKRWRAAIGAGVDFIATDQYESLAAALHH